MGSYRYTKCQNTWPLKVAKHYEILSLHRLNDINLVVDFSEIGQELCKTNFHATLNRENNNTLRTNQLLVFKREFLSEPYLEMPTTRMEKKMLARGSASTWRIIYNCFIYYYNIKRCETVPLVILALWYPPPSISDPLDRH